ncbi:NAD-dependent epimerase/dehydratase family protein [Methylomonas sp. MED-D]|uniref:NAD-dependent epimerase/dehydratase family protein n=1 Tax=unclassified Methylomonas TaxID=2608980 RepID=UPI0028A53445|nr:NAD(P)-dependent oxidoreductase [Methylomonas sp. MV1]MDT4328984.1 NAD(P)-dependent oxidoreductase [Methylomonas sp. MV1]
MTRHIIITGASGFLGRYVARHFANQGWLVSGIGHAAENFTPSIWGISHWVERDINSDSLSVLIEHVGKPGVLVHCAGTGSVGKSWETPLKEFERTVLTTATVIDALRRLAPNALLVYPSSAAVYGESEDDTLAEDSLLHPMSPYGLHKLAAEDLCLGAHRIFGINVAIIRFFSIYGPTLRKQLLWDITRKLGSGNSVLKLDGTGDECRDFIYADDAARLVGHIADMSPREPLVVNGATGAPTTVALVAKAIVEEMGKNDSVRVEFSGISRAGDPSRLVGDIRKLELIGFNSKVNVEEGIKHFISALNH